MPASVNSGPLMTLQGILKVLEIVSFTINEIRLSKIPVWRLCALAGGGGGEGGEVSRTALWYMSWKIEKGGKRQSHLVNNYRYQNLWKRQVYEMQFF